MKPEVDRLAFVCEMGINFKGEVMDSHVYEAVIKSHARVTYGEAQDIINEDEKHKIEKVQKNGMSYPQFRLKDIRIQDKEN